MKNIDCHNRGEKEKKALILTNWLFNTCKNGESENMKLVNHAVQKLINEKKKNGRLY
jgi:hypothetical protein